MNTEAIKDIQKKILIVKVGSTFIKNPSIGDYEDMLKRITILPNYSIKYEIIDITKPESSLPENLSNYLLIIIPGSHCMVTDHLSWSDKTGEWIKNIVLPSKIPLLGICYGHQLICQALGGIVDFNPKGKELGGVKIEFNQNCSKDGLFNELANHSHFVAESHSQSIIKPPCFDDFYVLAKSDCEDFEAVHFTGNIWGVQFHPEFSVEVTKEYEIKRKDASVAKNFVDGSYQFVDEEFSKYLMNKLIKYSLSLINA